MVFVGMIEFLVLGAFVLFIFQKIYRKWNELDLQEKKYDVKKTEKQYGEVSEIQKNHPDYEKNKEEVRKFQGK